MRVTYFGQACTLIEVAGKRILTDPWLTEGAYFGSWFHTHLLADAGITPQTIPKAIDYLFLSHEHEDHLDPDTLRHFPADIPIVICKFQTPKFRKYLTRLGLRNIRELNSGEPLALGGDASLTILGTAEYTNDAAILVEGEGCRVLNETDCKLSFAEYEKLGQKGIDLAFLMFSGANWYPMMYDYSPELQSELVRRRRRSLVRSFVQRAKVTKARIAVPSAGPCTVLDPELLWLNSSERGIFIDPEEAIRAVEEAKLPSQAVNMAATDVWDSRTGIERHAPESFRRPRQEYIREASARMAPQIQARRAAETPAGSDFSNRLFQYFNPLVAAQSAAMRKRINAKVGLEVSGPQASHWMIDFTAEGTEFVREGLAPDWTYKMQVEDKLLYPFLTGEMPFLEDLLLTLRVRCARRPDEFNEPLYNFLYEPDPEKLHNWYATR
jgi:UDP-MurNAc hydroxylase